MTSLRRAFLSRHSRIVPRSCIGVNYSKGLTRRPLDDEKVGKENSSHSALMGAVEGMLRDHMLARTSRLPASFTESDIRAMVSTLLSLCMNN